MAFCYAAYSTWEGRVLFLEDLYVSPPFRRQGISGALFTALARAAYAARCARMQWTVLDWNEGAIRAYTAPAIGATHMAGWDIYRLYAPDIKRVAEVAHVEAGAVG
jgi:diamine N-acetyltransferase